jgi:hypothetical protein
VSAFSEWLPRLRELGSSLRTAVRTAQAAGGARLGQPVGEGAGDVTFGLDVVAEQVVTTWLEAQPGPMSLLTEDLGWRHHRAQDFDHGGPRIAIDPVDGTRPLAADLRSAWAVIGFAPPGAGQPRFSDLGGGLLVELPTTRAGWARTLWAERGQTCHFQEAPLPGQRGAARDRVLRVDDDARCDHGFFGFFRYHPDQRPAIAAIEQAFFAGLAEEGADLRACYEDAYCSSAAQLVLLSLGTYRFQADLRAHLPRKPKAPVAKPYDLSGAIVVAEAAGVVLRTPTGGALDAPIDVSTPVAFAGYANAPTAARLQPHLLAALERGRG